MGELRLHCWAQEASEEPEDVMQEPGLYFPFVHIRDDDWLKMAALYWPSVRRLVPVDYVKHDSVTAQTFFDAHVLRDEDPEQLMPALGWDLARALRKNAARLVRDFSLARAHADWDGEARLEGGPDRDPQLGWIHVTKFPMDALRQLSQMGLARVGRSSDPVRGHAGPPADWIGVHPALAGAYMTALAGWVSKAAKFQPLTDQDDLRAATPSNDVGAALGLLMGRSTESANSEDMTGAGMETYVMLALQYARPENLPIISAEKVLQCRTNLAEELAVFRDYVASQRAELAELASVPIRRRRLEAFAQHVEHTVEIPLRKLEKGLSLHKLEPARSLLVAASFVPPAAVSVVGVIPPAAATTVGALAAVGSAWWQVNRVRESAKAGSPVGYLLDVRDRLTPKTLATRARRVLRGTYGRTKLQQR
ncbi:MAG TPA: hypothetical protein VFC00_25775 [Micromonosporaceae bacterium]|nr:hypothetical protein [Micromonosporaceae bacterium]